MWGGARHIITSRLQTAPRLSEDALEFIPQGSDVDGAGHLDLSSDCRVMNKLHVPWSFPELIHFLLFGNRISETKYPQSVTGPSTLKHVQDPWEALCQVMTSLERVCRALITG